MSDSVSGAPAQEAPPAERRFRALTFSGGFDAVAQLGVAHALLVSAGVAPDAVVGISTGAITAAALAEILQAGDRQAQVDKLRKFLDSYLSSTAEILRSLFPDTFEINARRPLKLLELPIHFKEEREDRAGAGRSKTGLIYAVNKLFGLRLTVRNFTLAAHCVLEYIDAADRPLWKRIWIRTRNAVRLWFLSARFLRLAPLVFLLLIQATRNPPERGDTAWRLLRHPLLSRAARLIGRASAIVAAAVIWLASGLALLVGLIWLLALIPGFPPDARGLAPALEYARRVSQLGLTRWAAMLGLFEWILAGVTFIVPALGRWRRAWIRGVLDAILEFHALSCSLGDPYALKQRLVDCFDREYYGRIEMDEILKRASRRDAPDALEPNAKRPKKTLGGYSHGEPGIRVGAIAAEVKTGRLSVLEGAVPVVDALLAATAFVPSFPAVEVAPTGLEKRFFIDGGNISREAVGPLLDLIRDDPELDQVAVVDVYPIHNLPRTGNGVIAGAPPTLIQVALRGLQLQRFRDATIEQRLTRLYSKVLPKQGGRVSIAGRTFLNVEVFPLGICTDLPGGDIWSRSADFDLRKLALQGVADGCRTALEGMIPGAIARAASACRVGEDTVPCRTVIEARLGRSEDLPGSDSSRPGLHEICEACTLRRSGQPDRSGHLAVPKETGERSCWPEWPSSHDLRSPAEQKAKTAADSSSSQSTVSAPAGAEEGVAQPATAWPDAAALWPLPRQGVQGGKRPLVSLLFGGGVFRGVFHMGVLNALNELELAPDVVAGSSVGSIIAAMIAQVFTLEDGKERRARIARLAATFLTIDRLVMTDRLADFVRGVTVRAGDADFSPRDLDLVLRRYDLDRSGVYGHRLRRVLAGVEQLFYLSPRDFMKLAHLGRTRRFGQLSRHLGRAFQDLLERSGVGREILGAEPLALLIRSHVIEPLTGNGAHGPYFSSFVDKGITFLATATNLTQGSLEILGDPRWEGPEGRKQGEVSLLEGLLASSAFPAVFRPRESWELFRDSCDQDLYFDGGIMDNLPLDAVARFLDNCPGIARRPRFGDHPAPHLLFTASLEVDKQLLATDSVEAVSRSFLRLRKRARTFTYNRKIDAYAKVQSDLRAAYEARLSGGDRPSWTPLDLHVVAVKPQWLCSTFGFHPMLGFRRRKQAQSIAHGCASTLAQLYAERDAHKEWSDAWGGRGLEHIDPKAVIVLTGRPSLVPRKTGKTHGECWFRNGVACPFSATALKELSLDKDTSRQLAEIYRLCGQPETHAPAHGVATS